MRSWATVKGMLEAIITKAAGSRLVRAVASLLIALTAGQVKCDDAAAPAPAPAQAPDAHAAAGHSGGVVPPVKDRGAAEEQEAQKLVVGGLKVDGVGDHPKLGITPAQVQALVDAEYGKLTEGGSTNKLSIAQLHEQLPTRLPSITRKPALSWRKRTYRRRRLATTRSFILASSRVRSARSSSKEQSATGRR